MHALYGVLEVKDIFEIEATKLVIIFFIFMNKWRALLVFGVWLAAGQCSGIVHSKKQTLITITLLPFMVNSGYKRRSFFSTTQAVHLRRKLANKYLKDLLRRKQKKQKKTIARGANAMILYFQSCK